MADTKLESVKSPDLILDIKPIDKRFANAIETKDFRFLDKSGDIKAIEKEGDNTFEKRVIKAVDQKDLKLTDEKKILPIEHINYLPIERRVIKAVDKKDINTIEKLNDKTTEKLIVKPIDIKQNDDLEEEPVMIIVTRDKCGYSIAMREFLRTHHIKFKDINVSKEGRGVLKEMNLEGLTFPMVHFKGKYIGGHDDSIINKEVLDYIKQNKEKKSLKSGKHGEDADESSSNLKN